MIKPDDAALLAQLRSDEGVRNMPYQDTEGVWSVGVGHNMQEYHLPADWTFPLSDARITILLAQDIGRTFADLDRSLSWWRLMNDTRQRAFANMCFNLGITKFLKFKRTLQAAHNGQWKTAAAEMLDSDWHEQVGERAERLAAMIETGVA